MSDTPRTDKEVEVGEWHTPYHRKDERIANLVPADFARTLERELAAWQETANQHCRNESFYHGLLDAIGQLFGDEAKRQDDGGLCEDVLALRVHECVYAALAELAEARKDAERYRWLKECTNEQFEYLEKEWCGLDNAIDCLMAVEHNA